MTAGSAKAEKLAELLELSTTVVNPHYVAAELRRLSSIELRAEALEQELDIAQQANAAAGITVGELLIERAALRAECEALRKDAERLDWLKTTNQRGHFCGQFNGHLLTRERIDLVMGEKHE